MCTGEMGNRYSMDNITVESAGRGQGERVEVRNKIIVEEKTCLVVAYFELFETRDGSSDNKTQSSLGIIPYIIR